MVSSMNQIEVFVAYLTHGDLFIWDPDGGRVADVALHPGQRVQLVRREERGLLVAVLLDGAVQGVQPVIPLLNIPEKQEKMMNIL